jgi:hypothetical protein
VNEVAGSVTGSHVYADNGTFTVGVCVSDDDGGAHCDALTITTLNVPPVVEAGSDREIDEGQALSLSVPFSDAGSADTHTATIDWGSGPEAVTVDQNANKVTGSHPYSNDGIHTIVVCITDDDGGADCGQFTLTVLNLAPSVSAGGGIDVDEDDKFTALLATFSDPGVYDTHSATIDWGDGSAPEQGVVDQTAGEVSGEHTYPDPGEYTVTITVCDDAGACAAVTLSATVNPTPEGRIEALKVFIEQMIEEGLIDRKAKNSMFSKLDAALKSLKKGNDHTAVNQIGAFINYVEAQSGKKIDADVGLELIARAEQIIGLIEGEQPTWPRNAFNLTSICRLDKDTGQMRVRNESDSPQAFTLWIYKGDYEIEDIAPIGDSLWPVPWNQPNDTYLLNIAGYEFVKAIGKNKICKP